MPDTLDTLAAKAEALDFMRSRNDPNYPAARDLYKQELENWKNKLTNQVCDLLNIKLPKNGD